MDYTRKEVLEFVRESDVKFIRLAFCDMFGVQKNISIMADELERAFENGISFDASAIDGFMDVSKSDLFLYPDPATLSFLPWRPQQGRVIRFFCDINYPDKATYYGDTRNFLKAATKRLESMGYTCKIGTECEFYLFKTDEDGNPTTITHDNGGYLDISPLDKGENVRREICLTLEEMGIKPETSHHEQGPGQHEIDFKYSDPLTAADNFIAFKSVVKAIAARNGLYATFMPKPIAEQSGSGLHINLSLSKDGSNIFNNNKDEHSQEAESFIAGIISKISELTAFLNPIINSYERFGSYKAPKYVSWSHQNRSQLIRIPAASGEKKRMELRSPDSAINPYLAFALILHAGLDGIQKQLPLPKPMDINLFTANKDVIDSIPALPSNLCEALDKLKESSFINDILGADFVHKYIDIKQQEYNAYMNAADKERFNMEHYFTRI